jgi:hypothetical protein
MAKKRATPGSIGRVIGKAIPSVQVLQIRPSRIWLTEQDEPFAEIDIFENGAFLMMRISTHCSPAWAGIVTSLLNTITTELHVSPHMFIQTHDGRILYGTDADEYHSLYQSVRPLLAMRSALSTRQ